MDDTDQPYALYRPPAFDASRRYRTGLSMGGGGALWIALTRPDLWAAIAPVCPAPPTGTRARAPNALNIPMHIVQGAADPVGTPGGVRDWVAALDALGTDVTDAEYPGVGHLSWEGAYADGQIFDWFDQHVRNPHPDRVRFTTSRYKYNRAYWVRVDALTPGPPAHIEATVATGNRLTVTPRALDGFSLFVGPAFAARPSRPAAGHHRRAGCGGFAGGYALPQPPRRAVAANAGRSSASRWFHQSADSVGGALRPHLAPPGGCGGGPARYGCRTPRYRRREAGPLNAL